MTNQNTQSRKKSWVIFLVVAIIILAGSLAFAYHRSQDGGASDSAQKSLLTDAERFSQEYPKVSADNRYVYASTEEVFEVFERGSGVVFLGFPECPWCQHLAPMLDEAASAEGIDKIYYLNIRQARADNDETYRKLVAILGEDLPKDEQGEPRIFVPDVTAVSGGQVMMRFTQEPAGPNERTPEQYWTSERQTAAMDKLRQLVAATKNSTE